MIITDFYRTRNKVKLYRTYSDQNLHIQRDGEIYEQAIDPEGTNRIYTETDIPIIYFQEQNLNEENF